ncbi:hypothetical protein M407DRAFT_82390, partial [Tulasnella calospora MUT 4182]
PDIYLHEIQQELLNELGVDASIPTIHQTIKRTGYMLKQVIKHLSRTSTTTVNISFESVLSIIGTSLFLSMKVHAIDRLPIVVALGLIVVRFKVLYLALSLDGILHVTVVQGAYTELKFTNFIKGVLLKMNQFPAKNSVLIMDNAIIHKSPALREMIEERYILIFLGLLSSNV